MIAKTTLVTSDSNIAQSGLRAKGNLSSYITEASNFTADFRHSWIQVSNTINRAMSFSNSLALFFSMLALFSGRLSM